MERPIHLAPTMTPYLIPCQAHPRLQLTQVWPAQVDP